jgi:molybdopterin-binding protein
MLSLTGLDAQRLLRPAQLSGGQKQRVALARALAVRPELLLLDEPFSAVDAPTRQSLIEDVQRLLAGTGTPTVLVTHDRNEAIRLADQVAVMIGGRIRQSGPPSDVFGAPVDEEVAQFVGVEVIVPGVVRSLEGGVAVTEVAGHTIEGGSGVSASESVLVCLRPEDIVITPRSESASPTSARNHIPAVVTRITPWGPFRRAELDAGFPLVALITRHAEEDLALTPGAPVTATFKATAVHLVPRQGIP